MDAIRRAVLGSSFTGVPPRSAERNVHMTSFTLRPLTPADGQAFANLLLASPDTGQVHYTISYKIDPFQALVFNQEDLAGVVAEIPGVPGLVGGGLIGFKQARVENTLLPSALLNTLIVHPDHRRIGIASAVAKWRLDYTRQRFAKRLFKNSR
jgi:GNAT superfamily N-acetyltransferase